MGHPVSKYNIYLNVESNSSNKYLKILCSRNLEFSVTEDLCKKTREARLELRKHMRDVKRKHPGKHCALEKDKLFIEGKIFFFCETSGRVIEQTSQHQTLNNLKR